MIGEGLDEVMVKGNRTLGILVELMKFLEEKEILSEDEIKTVLERATQRIDGALEKSEHGPTDGPTLVERKPELLPPESPGGDPVSPEQPV